MWTAGGARFRQLHLKHNHVLQESKATNVEVELQEATMMNSVDISNSEALDVFIRKYMPEKYVLLSSSLQWEMQTGNSRSRFLLCLQEMVPSNDRLY